MELVEWRAIRFLWLKESAGGFGGEVLKSLPPNSYLKMTSAQSMFCCLGLPPK